MKRFFVILSILFLCSGCMRKEEIVVKKTSLKEVSYSSVYHIINHYDLYQNILILDVRDADHYANGHIIGASNVLVSDFEDTDFDPDMRVIVYADGKRDSIVACRKLQKIGVDAEYLPGISNYPYELV